MSIQKIVGLTTRRITEGFYAGCVEAEIHTVDFPPEEMTPFMKEVKADYDRAISETLKRIYQNIGSDFEKHFLKLYSNRKNSKPHARIVRNRKRPKNER